MRKVLTLLVHNILTTPNVLYGIKDWLKPLDAQKVGDFSCGGQPRGKEATKACNHDMDVKEKLIPFGILNVLAGILTIIFGTSRQMSGFIADGLQQWWDTSKDSCVYIRQLVINLDNGPENSSFGTQFMNRMVEFADRNNLEFVLVYYLPFHSKHNPIERC